MAPDWPAIAAAIGHAASHPFVPRSVTALHGGSINRAFRLEDQGRRYFVKTNTSDRRSMFEAEAQGLSALHVARAVRVPEVVGTGADARCAWIAIEYLDLDDNLVSPNLGLQMAQLHHQSAGGFGWYRDNTIGSTPQPNTWSDNWIEFLREQRLGFQLRLALQNGYGGRLQTSGATLLERLNGFFPGYRPVPSLLHGDLWAGNAASLVDGEPVIFDPAVYYGDRETDLAMTELFGGFPAGFYDQYRAAWPLDPGYRVRKRLYNLYHLLNHLNLFGGTYLARAQETIDTLLSEVKL